MNEHEIVDQGEAEVEGFAAEAVKPKPRKNKLPPNSMTVGPLGLAASFDGAANDIAIKDSGVE